MKRPTMLAKAMLTQMSMDLDLSVERDQRTLADRCKHEGLSFLTITLPALSDALERGLENGTFTCPSNFSRHGRLPRFLGGFFKRVFDKDGRLLPDACPYTIAGIRQICRFFKKLKLPCTEAREKAAESNFLEVEGELRHATPQIERKDDVLDKISGIVWAQVFPEPDYLSLVCRHGPGVTADRLRSNERYRIRKWYQRSEFSFPSDLHCYPNYGIAAGAAAGSYGESSVDYVDLKDEAPVRVVFVPKTQSTPRVIAIEPHNVQYMQQAVKDLMYDAIECHRLTKRSLRFTDQSVNQRLAYISSKNQRLTTLDLKDASDRVHLHLVNRIFAKSGILELLQDSRSLHADLPSGKNIVLWKFASMGSACCFPVEACVFYTLIQSAMHIHDGIRPSSATVLNYSGKIAIYGDDIIVPTEYTDTVVRYLESYALKVNVHKSFRFSKFRESCGANFYDGVDVKPIYAREMPWDDARDWTPSSLMSWAATSDQFYMKGQWHIAQFIRDMVSRIARCPIPRSREPGAGLVFRSLLFTTGLGWNRGLQCWKQRRIVFSPIKMKDEINDDYLAGLQKWGIHSFLRERSAGKPAAQALLGRGESVSRTISDGEDRQPSGRRSSLQRDVHLHAGFDPAAGGETPSWTFPPLGKCCEFFSESPFTSAEERRALQCEVGGRDEGIRSALNPAHGPVYDSTDSGRGLDFVTSVKRGDFKSNRRWISLHS